MAIEDGVVLAEKVATSSGDFERAFLAYQQDRYLRTARVVLTSRWFGHFMHTPILAARHLANQMMAARTEDTYEQIDWLYGGIEPCGL